MKAIQRTSNAVIPTLPRLVAGGVLTFFSLMHFRNPEHFRHILTAAGFPMVDMNVTAASVMELVAGLLLLSGFFTRIGGALGIATMLPAIYATIKLSGLTPESLPAGLSEVPMVPPLPLPIVVTVTSIAAIVMGGGRFSIDRRMTNPASCDGESVS